MLGNQDLTKYALEVGSHSVVDNFLFSGFTEDGVRLSGSGIELTGSTFVDSASLIDPSLADDAHRDHAQALKAQGEGFWNQQYAAGEISDLTVKDCRFVSPWSLCQPLSVFDGFIRRANIEDNHIFTASDHEISIAVMGGWIANNRALGRPAKIRLLPVRIGGGLEGQPEIKILSFADDNDVYVPANMMTDDRNFTDERGKIEDDGTVYLENFCLSGFREAALGVASHVAEGDGPSVGRGANAMCADFRELALNYGVIHKRIY